MAQRFVFFNKKSEWIIWNRIKKNYNFALTNGDLV